MKESIELSILRTHRNEPLHLALDIIRDNHKLYVGIWEQVESLYFSHLYDIVGYSLSIPQILEVCKACLIYNIKHVAQYYKIPYGTLIKLLDEFAAAFCFVIDNKEVFPIELLNEYSYLQYEQFREGMDKRYFIDSIMQEDSINEVLERLPVLKELVTQLRNHGTIRPFLKNINLKYENIVNVDNSFYRFITTGYLKGGNLTLIRRVLYAQWLQTHIKRENRDEVEIPKAIAGIGEWAFLSEASREDFVKRNIRLFLEYLIINDIKSYLNRADLSDQDFLDVYPVQPLYIKRRMSPNRLQFSTHGLNDMAKERAKRIFILKEGIITVPMDWSKFFSRLGSGPMPELLRNYIIKFVKSRERMDLINSIAETLELKPSSARKVYDKSLLVIDYLLSTKVPYKEWVSLEKLLDQSIVTKVYEDYKKAILNLYKEA